MLGNKPACENMRFQMCKVYQNMHALYWHCSKLMLLCLINVQSRYSIYDSINVMGHVKFSKDINCLMPLWVSISASENESWLICYTTQYLFLPYAAKEKYESVVCWMVSYIGNIICCQMLRATENNLCTRVTNCCSAHERIIFVFNSRVAKQRGAKKNNTRVSAGTVRHASTYIILFLTRHNECINDIVITWIVIFNSLDIDFIHGDINDRSC